MLYTYPSQADGSSGISQWTASDIDLSSAAVRIPSGRNAGVVGLVQCSEQKNTDGEIAGIKFYEIVTGEG